jgi:hypothetical protein
MVEWVIDALRGSESIAEIAVVLPTTKNLGRWADKVDKLVVSDSHFIDNVLAGIDSFRNERSVLVATGDLPALTSEAIDDYVTRSLEAGAEVSYPLVAKEEMERQFPGSQRTYIRLATGSITGGNMMVLSPSLVHRNRDIGQRLFETRKSPVKMARIIGLPFIFRLVAGRLDPADVEAKMEEILGGTCVAIRTNHASIGADVDKPVDVIVTERVLFERDGGRT